MFRRVCAQLVLGLVLGGIFSHCVFAQSDPVQERLAELSEVPNLQMPYFDGNRFLKQAALFASYCDWIFYKKYNGDLAAFSKAVREHRVQWVVGSEDPHPDTAVELFEGFENTRKTDRSKMRWELSQVNDPESGPIFVPRFAPPENGGTDKFRVRIRRFPIAANRQYIQKEIEEPDSKLASDEVEVNLLLPLPGPALPRNSRVDAWHKFLHLYEGPAEQGGIDEGEMYESFVDAFYGPQGTKTMLTIDRDSPYRELNPDGDHWKSFGRRLAHNAGDGKGRAIIDITLRQNNEPRSPIILSDFESATYKKIPPKWMRYSYFPIIPLPNREYLKDEVAGHLRPMGVREVSAALATSLIKGSIWFGTFTMFGGVQVTTAAYAASVRFLTHLILDSQFEAYNERARHARTFWGPEKSRAFWGQVLFRFLTFLPTTIIVKIIKDSSDTTPNVIATSLSLYLLWETLGWLKVGLASFNDKIGSAVISFIPNISQKYRLNEGKALGLVKKSWLQNESRIWVRGLSEALGVATKSGLPVQLLMVAYFYNQNVKFVEKLKRDRPDLAADLQTELESLENNFFVKRIVRPIVNAKELTRTFLRRTKSACARGLELLATESSFDEGFYRPPF